MFVQQIVPEALSKLHKTNAVYSSTGSKIKAGIFGEFEVYIVRQWVCIMNNEFGHFCVCQCRLCYHYCAAVCTVFIIRLWCVQFG